VISNAQSDPNLGTTRKRFDKPGRMADRQRSREIADIVNQYDDRWWNGSVQWKSELSLRNICRDLDNADILVPANWPEGRTPSFLQYSVDAASWQEALETWASTNW
jgi:hypothetical protein